MAIQIARRNNMDEDYHLEQIQLKQDKIDILKHKIEDMRVCENCAYESSDKINTCEKCNSDLSKWKFNPLFNNP